MYYAVHQAGKAVVAAWAADKWRVKGHGLIQVGDDDEDRPSAWQSDILRFQVKPYRKRPGVLDAVASTLGTARLTGSVELGALWSALPEASPHPDASSWPLALPVYPHSYESAVPPFVSPAFRGFVCLRGLPAPEDAAVMNRLLAMYPDGSGAKAETYQGTLQFHKTPWGPGVSVQWPTPGVQARYGEPPPAELVAAHVHNRVPRYRRTEEHWLIPEVGDGSDQLPPLLLWWVLLFGLSLLARYEPATWRAALDLDRSPVADPLKELLDDALVIVPDLLFEAATQDRRAMS